MKFLYLLILSSLVFASCTTYDATARTTRNLRYDAVQVTPQWKYKAPGAKKWIVPVVSIGAGAAYGYNSELTYDGETYSGKENAAIMAGAGLLSGLILNAVLFPKKNKRFVAQQTDNWLKNYNESSGNNYVFSKYQNNNLILVPAARMIEIRNNYRSLAADLNGAAPTTSFAALQEWKKRLDQEYSVLPTQELNQARELLSRHTPLVAGRELNDKLDVLINRQVSYETFKRLRAFRADNSTLFAAANTLTKSDINARLQQKETEALRTELAATRSALRAIGSGKNDFSAVNSLYQDFKRKYLALEFSDRSGGIAELNKEFSRKKVYLLVANSSAVMTDAGNSNSIPALEELERYYLPFHTSAEPAVTKVKGVFAKRRSEIERATRLAARQREERLEQERQRIQDKEKIATYQKQSETTPTGEPTEWQMNQAIVDQMRLRTESLQPQSNGSYDSKNPIDVLTTLFGMATKGTEIKVTQFEKYGCREAANRPGYVCDYVAKTSIQGGMVGQMWGGYVNRSPSSISSARFLKKDGRWIVVQFLNN